jgi:hypothetical protein
MCFMPVGCLLWVSLFIYNVLPFFIFLNQEKSYPVKDQLKYFFLQVELKACLKLIPEELL